MAIQLLWVWFRSPGTTVPQANKTNPSTNAPDPRASSRSLRLASPRLTYPITRLLGLSLFRFLRFLASFLTPSTVALVFAVTPSIGCLISTSRFDSYPVARVVPALPLVGPSFERRTSTAPSEPRPCLRFVAYKTCLLLSLVMSLHRHTFCSQLGLLTPLYPITIKPFW